MIVVSKHTFESKASWSYSNLKENKYKANSYITLFPPSLHSQLMRRLAHFKQSSHRVNKL